MDLMHIALGGCISAGPIAYGKTEDTGGHISYLLGATRALASRSDIGRVDIVTRAFLGPGSETRYDRLHEPLDATRSILRLRSASRDYLEKEALEAELPELVESFLALLQDRPLPDVIHAHFADAAELAMAARTTYGIPFLYSSHSLGLQKDSSDDLSHARRIAREGRAIAAADAIICSSRDEAERQIPSYGPSAGGQVFRACPGVDTMPDPGTGPARALIAPFLASPRKPIILAIARPVEKKNLGGLVAAYAGSPELQNSANLIILAGQRDGLTQDGSEAARITLNLFDQVDRHGLWGKVALPRRHRPEEVAGLYALAAQDGVFVNPALHEPFGLTVVEALQYGVPVVATRHGGPPEILRDTGLGLAIDPLDPAAITSACQQMLTMPDRRHRAERASRHAAEKYNWSQWAADVHGIMARLAVPQPAPRRKNAERLLVSDIDGTLTGSRDGINGLLQALEQAQRTELVYATGRSISEARRVLSQWGLPEPGWMTTSVGSEIWRRTCPGRYRPVDGFAAHIAQDWARADIVKCLSRAGFPFQPPHEQRAFKISLDGDEMMARRVRILLERNGHSAHVISSHGRFVDILPRRAGKAAAAEWLSRHLGLDPQDCIAAGDSGNDRDLLSWAGAAILPANAYDEIGDLAGPRIYRARARHAEGVLEGLQALGVLPASGLQRRLRQIAAE